jgi:hypothetical protein
MYIYIYICVCIFYVYYVYFVLCHDIYDSLRHTEFTCFSIKLDDMHIAI